jgi:hypothetical protein
MNNDLPSYSIAAHAFIALFGAVVHAAKAYRAGATKTLLDFATLTVMSSFSGVMFALVALYMFPDQHYLTLAMAGTGGFLGVEGMTLIIERVRQLITKAP